MMLKDTEFKIVKIMYQKKSTFLQKCFYLNNLKMVTVN